MAVVVRRRMVFVAGLAVWLGGCSTGNRQGESGTVPSFSSIEQIGAASDIIVVGSFSGLTTVNDDGGNPGGGGIAMSVGELKISRASSDMATSLMVAFPDRRSDETSGLEGIVTGQTYLLFGERVEKSSRGGLQQYDDLYNIVGYGNGIFAVTGDEARVLGPGFAQTGGGSSPDASSRVYSVEDLLKTPTRH